LSKRDFAVGTILTKWGEALDAGVDAIEVLGAEKSWWLMMRPMPVSQRCCSSPFLRASADSIRESTRWIARGGCFGRISISAARLR